MGIPVQPMSPTVVNIAPMAGVVPGSPVFRLMSKTVMNGMMVPVEGLVKSSQAFQQLEAEHFACGDADAEEGLTGRVDLNL
jgi:hypothetical protein